MAANGRRDGGALGQESSFGKWQADGDSSCSLKASKKSVNPASGIGEPGGRKDFWVLVTLNSAFFYDDIYLYLFA